MPLKTNKKKILFIVNPVSGVGRKKNIEEAVEKHLLHERFNPLIRYTQKPGDATEFAKEAVEDHYDIVVAVGGDGSINEAGRGIVGSDTLLGIVPAGSGNGLAHHLGFPMKTSRAVEIINELKVKKIDSFTLNNIRCFSIAGTGFDSLVAQKFEETKKRGFQTYFNIVLQEYMNYKPKKYKLIIDGEKISEKALFVSLANSNQFGYNATIAPHARIDDGLIDVCIIKKVPVTHAFILANLMFLKQIDKSRYITIIKGKEIEIKGKHIDTVNIDGEYYPMEKKLSIKIHPESISVIVP